MNLGQNSSQMVQLLREWVTATPDDRAPIRALNDPVENAFENWVRELVEPLYYNSLNQIGGEELEDFVEECKIGLLRWTQRHRGRMHSVEITGARLERVVKAIARQRRISIWRRLRRRQVQAIGDHIDGCEDEVHANLLETQNHELLDQFPMLERDFKRADTVVSEFFESIRGQVKMRQVLAIVVKYCQLWSEATGRPRNWIVFHLLMQRRAHLPEELRLWLRERFGPLDYSAINARIGHIRRSFLAYLSNHGLRQWAERAAMGPSIKPSPG